MSENSKYVSTYSNKIFIWLILGTAAAVLFDQLMKYAAVLHLKGQPPYVMIPGVLELRYLENQGAAFGILQNRQYFFTIITLVFIAISIYVIVRIPKNRYYLPAIIAFMFLFSGAIGNFIDRTAQHYVVDFIYFSIIDFPIFNVADIYVTLSMAAIILLLLFHYKDGDMDFLKSRSRGSTDEKSHS